MLNVPVWANVTPRFQTPWHIFIDDMAYNDEPGVEPFIRDGIPNIRAQYNESTMRSHANLRGCGDSLYHPTFPLGCSSSVSRKYRDFTKSLAIVSTFRPSLSRAKNREKYLYLKIFVCFSLVLDRSSRNFFLVLH